MDKGLGVHCCLQALGSQFQTAYPQGLEPSRVS